MESGRIKPPHTETPLRCKHNTAGLILIASGVLFLLIGCTGLYKTIGLTEEQAAAQTAKDQAATQQITNQIRLTTTELITTSIAGAGAILSGLLAKWLGTERKITTALITGIESAKNDTVKETIHAKATAAGIEPLLHARVKALT